MSWIRRETEKGTIQYICPRCHDYHEFREDFDERTFSENYIFCRRCGERNGTGNAPTLTQPNEWVSVEKRLPEDDAPAGRKQITMMVTTKAGKVTIASRIFEPERDYCGRVYPARWLWSRWLNNHVTHWMELPAPPGKDNNVPTKAQNEPLTWEELKEMAGEPVYIVEPKKAISSWMLIDVVDEKSMWCVVGFGSSYRNFYKTYGKTWIAYRRPPEGEEET